MARSHPGTFLLPPYRIISNILPDKKHFPLVTNDAVMKPGLPFETRKSVLIAPPFHVALEMINYGRNGIGR